MCWALVTSAFAAYFALLCLYRIFVSPLSRIPGPVLAAATGWYETYYELWHSFGGQYLFHIQDLHRRYGEADNAYLSLFLNLKSLFQVP